MKMTVVFLLHCNYDNNSPASDEDDNETIRNSTGSGPIFGVDRLHNHVNSGLIREMLAWLL